MNHPAATKNTTSNWLINTAACTVQHQPSGLEFTFHKRASMLSRGEHDAMLAAGTKAVREFSPNNFLSVDGNGWLITTPDKPLRAIYDSFPVESQANLELHNITRAAMDQWLQAVAHN